MNSGMFLTWSPLPEVVIRTTQKTVQIPTPRVSRRLLSPNAKPRRLAPAVAEVDLKCYELGGWRSYRAWHAASRTVVVGPTLSLIERCDRAGCEKYFEKLGATSRISTWDSIDIVFTLHGDVLEAFIRRHKMVQNWVESAGAGVELRYSSFGMGFGKAGCHFTIGFKDGKDSSSDSGAEE